MKRLALLVVLVGCDLPPGLEESETLPPASLGKVLGNWPADAGADADPTAGASPIAVPAR